jgi:ankyrin repeat protein
VSIFELIEAGDRDALCDLLDDRPEAAEERDAEGLSPVLRALYSGKGDLVDPILDANPALDVFDAAAVGRNRGLEELLEGEPELAGAWSPDGFTALHLAAYFGQKEAAEILLDRGADPRLVSRHSQLQVAPVQSAAAGGHDDIARLLLERGASLDDFESEELRARYADAT